MSIRSPWWMHAANDRASQIYCLDYCPGMKLFASYSRKDAAVVESIVVQLEAKGHSVWVDTDDIRGGEQWRQAIIAGITSSEKLILFLSPQAVASVNVRREVTVADEHHLQIIPVLLAPCEVPYALQYSLAGMQWIDASSRPMAETVAEIDGVLTGAPLPPSPAATNVRSRRGMVVAAIAAIAGLVLIIALVQRGSGSQKPAPTAPTGPTVANDTAAPVVPSSAVQSNGVATASFTSANGRSTVFGGMAYQIEAIDLTNGRDGSGFPVFGEPAEFAGDRTVAQISVVLRNRTSGPLYLAAGALLRLVDDPVEVAAYDVNYDAAGLGAGAGGRATYVFELPKGVTVDAGVLEGAEFILTAPKLISDGIALDGAIHEPVANEPIDVGASIFVGGDAGGTLTVNSIEASLEARGLSGRGPSEAKAYRAPRGEVWLLMNVTLDCGGRFAGGDCYFGLEQQIVRVKVDNSIEGFEAAADFAIFDATGAIGPGTSKTIDVLMRVAVGETYALLLGDPDDPTSVQTVPLNLQTSVSALYDSVARFQQ